MKTIQQVIKSLDDALTEAATNETDVDFSVVADVRDELKAWLQAGMEFDAHHRR